MPLGHSPMQSPATSDSTAQCEPASTSVPPPASISSWAQWPDQHWESSAQPRQRYSPFDSGDVPQCCMPWQTMPHAPQFAFWSVVTLVLIAAAIDVRASPRVTVGPSRAGPRSVRARVRPGVCCAARVQWARTRVRTADRSRVLRHVDADAVRRGCIHAAAAVARRQRVEVDQQ